MNLNGQNGRNKNLAAAHNVIEQPPSEITEELENEFALKMRDIHPRTPVSSLRREYSQDDVSRVFSTGLVSALTGMSSSYIHTALGKRSTFISLGEVLQLLDLDAFSETFVPRSQIPKYLLSKQDTTAKILNLVSEHQLIQGSAKELLSQLPHQSVSCVVTSTPYWGTRIYSESYQVEWADGEVCPFGHEQTPEGFIRHTVELLYLLKPAMAHQGSVWWNLMDTYNTRTQIRSNAAETLRAMKGHDSRGWNDHECRRYSAGHSFLKDGEQCLIPMRVVERAARIGYWTKSVITWKKTGSMPETVGSRVTRELEYIIHLSVQRTPYFDKAIYNELPLDLGGRHARFEAEKLTDVWCLSTSSGQDGHGAQFPLSLPGRCIALSTCEGDLVLDPFVGGGTTAIAAKKLNRRALGFDINEKYLDIAKRKLAKSTSPTEQLILG